MIKKILFIFAAITFPLIATAQPSGMVSAPPEVIDAALQRFDPNKVCTDNLIYNMLNTTRALAKCYSSDGKSLNDPVVNMTLEQCGIIDTAFTPHDIYNMKVFKRNDVDIGNLKYYDGFLSTPRYENRILYFTDPSSPYYKKRVSEVKDGDIKAYLEKSANILQNKFVVKCKEFKSNH